MSGYMGESIYRYPELDPRVNLVAKPFDRSPLLTRIHAALSAFEPTRADS